MNRRDRSPYLLEAETVFSELSEQQSILADLWRAYLRQNGLMPGEGHTLESLGTPDEQDPICTELAEARGLLADAWGVAKDVQGLRPTWDRDKAALASLIGTIKALSVNTDVTERNRRDKLVDPGLDVLLLWAIELAEADGVHRGMDPDVRQAAVNWEKHWKTTDQWHDPEGAPWDEDNNDIAGDLFRGDGLVSNPQVVYNQGVGKKYFTWNLGLKGTWNPNETNFQWSYYRPNGLLRQAIMSYLHDLADVIKLKVATGKMKQMRGIKLNVGKPKAPMKVTIPWDVFIERVVSERDYLQEHWDIAASIRTKEQFWAWVEGVKLDPKVVAFTLAPAAECITPSRHKQWMEWVRETLAQRIEWRTTILALISLQWGNKKLKLPGSFTISVWGDIKELYREALGLPGAPAPPPTTRTSRAHTTNGAKAAASRLAAKLKGNKVTSP